MSETESNASGADASEGAKVPRTPEKRERRERDRGDRPRKRRRPKPPVFRSEAEINVPDRLTLGMLAVISLVTIVLWGFARGACNHHPPRETRRARVVKTEEYARDPKSSAVELVQRLGAGDFKGATELAVGPAVQAVDGERASCEANAAACALRRKKAADVITTGVLLERDPSSATARVETRGPDGKRTLIVTLQREGSLWKVGSFEPDTGKWQPKPTSSAQELPLPIGTAPGAPSARPTLRLVPSARPPQP